MKKTITALVVVVLALGAVVFAKPPKLLALQLQCDAYDGQSIGASNVVIVVYRSTSLGTTWSPFKRAGIFPASRTNFAVRQLEGTKCQYYLTAQMNLPSTNNQTVLYETEPSNIITHITPAP